MVLLGILDERATKIGKIPELDGDLSSSVTVHARCVGACVTKLPTASCNDDDPPSLPNGRLVQVQQYQSRCVDGDV